MLVQHPGVMGQAALTDQRDPSEKWGPVICDALRPAGHTPPALWRPLGESNPCFRRERPMSWATRRRGLR